MVGEVDSSSAVVAADRSTLASNNSTVRWNTPSRFHIKRRSDADANDPPSRQEKPAEPDRSTHTTRLWHGRDNDARAPIVELRNEGDVARIVDSRITDARDGATVDQIAD